MSSGVSRGEIFANRREMRRGSRGNPSLKAATQGKGGEGREAARSAAGDAGNAKPSSSASSSHELRKSTSIETRAAPWDLAEHRGWRGRGRGRGRRFAPLSLSTIHEMIDATFGEGGGANITPTAPMLPRHHSPPRSERVPPMPLSPYASPLAVPRRPPPPEATSFSFALDCTTLLVLNFATLFELPAPRATSSILVSNNFNTPRGLGADAHHNETAFNITELV
ncbi:hypothetical protein GGG16DRAFT_106970 [Schizophyllum commune]